MKEFLTFFGKDQKLYEGCIHHSLIKCYIACVTLILLLLTTVNAAICWYNFDKGLKPHLLKRADEPSQNTEENAGGRTLSLD